MALTQLLIIVSVCAACTMAATYIIVPVPDTSAYRDDSTLMKRWGGLNFKKPSFWGALTNRDDDQGEQHHAILDSHLLPDHLLHEEFLKPQLQAAGFKGGKIIAGPFPVPLSKLPKPHGLGNPVQPAQGPKQTAPSNAIYAVNKPSYKPVPPASSAPYQPTAQFSLVKPSAVSYHKAASYYPTVFKPSLPATYQPIPSTSQGVVGGISNKQTPTETRRSSVKLVYGGWAPIYDHIDRENDAQLQAVSNEEPAVTKEQTNPEAVPLPASRRTAKSARNDKGQTFVALAEENKGSQTEDIITASSVQPVEIGRGQGRFVGRVLSGSVRGARDDVVSAPKWQKTNENISLSSVGYTIRFAERR